MTPQQVVVLVPIGSLEAESLSWLADALARALGRIVRIAEEIPLPAGGYGARRRQYRGEALLAALRGLALPEAERVLGLTEADCFAPGLNFVFGQAIPRGREAFVALPRLHQSFYGLPEERTVFRRRALTEAVHELGHTWGLPHCDDPRCVMRFSNTLGDTAVKGSRFCPRCQGRLERHVQGEGRDVPR